jgi:hypothetical protein
MPFFIIESAVWVIRTSRLHLCNQNRRGKRFGLKQAIGLADDCLIRQNPIGQRSRDLTEQAVVSAAMVARFERRRPSVQVR